MNHPFFAVCEMIRKSATVAKEQNDEDREKLRHCFALGDMSEPEFFRAMRHLGADDHEIAEFIQFTKGDE